MISVAFSPKFARQLKKLETSLKDEAIFRMNLLKDRSNHNSLRVHKLSGKLAGCWSFSVNYRYRIIFEYISPNEVVLLAIDDHDIYKQPFS